MEFDDFSVNRVKTNLKNGREADFVGVSKLYVGNLGFQVMEKDLVEHFGEKGEVGEVSIVRDDTGRSR